MSGPKHIVLGQSDVVLVCMLKDGTYYLDELLEHHRAIGIEHFLFIDNGSSDGTQARLAEEPDVTVYSNTLPAKDFECLLRGQIARRVVRGGWFLFVDSDELMVFCRGEGRKISEFAGYCNEHGYDAVMSQTLDFFAPVSLRETADWSYARSIEGFNLYSTENISRYDYDDADGIVFSWYLRNNRPSNAAIKFMFGGIRNEVFGEDCCLTKHGFVRNAPHIDLYSHPHCSGNLHCADFTFLIRHYKFAGPFLDRERAQVQTANWDHGEDEQRMSIVQDQENFVISGRHQQPFRGTEPLIAQGLLECSARFLERFPKRAGDASVDTDP